MSTKRCVKWHEDARSFFNAVPDKSVVLDLVISIGCISQTGEGFEDLVNSLNSEEIKKKLKKINITDTSYLYRHVNPDFDKYSDINLQTVWFLTNKHAIEQLSIDTSYKSWVEGVNSDIFRHWHRQIIKDFEGNENGIGVVQEFRELVIADAAVAAAKGSGSFENCKKFILEECAYVCANLKNAILAYPMSFYESMKNVIKRYDLNILYYSYKPSNYSSKRNSSYHRSRLNEEIITFLTEMLDATLFVIDKNGNYIYKNSKLTGIVGEIPADTVNTEAWESSLQVMKTKQQSIFEEQHKGKDYLSVKAPLIIDGEVEGVIGTAIDITDRKKAEDHARMQACYESAKSVAHDVLSPLLALKLIVKENQKVISLLDEEPRKTLRASLSDMTQILESLVYTKKHEELVPQALYPLIERCLQARRYISSFTAFDLLLKEPVEAKVEPLMFRRVFDNLLSTLLPPTSKDIRLLIEVGRNTEGNPQVTIKDKSHIFTIRDFDEIFERNTQISDDSGIGVGPAGFKKIIESWNGQLLVTSQDNATIVQIVFPKDSSAEKVVPFAVKEPTFA